MVAVGCEDDVARPGHSLALPSYCILYGDLPSWMRLHASRLRPPFYALNVMLSH